MNARGPRSPLDRLVAEVRAQRVPEPVESGLPLRLRAEFQDLASGLRSAPSRARPALRRWWPALALAAAGAALVLLRWATVAEPIERPDAPIAELDGQSLDVGVLVVAADQPRRVEHPGRASWLLAPGSQARLLSVAGELRISLEQGSLTAEVEPSQARESFVVQAQGTEVAVHGTRFAVSVHGGRVHVVVTQGQVQVRPVAIGRVVLPTSGTLLGPGMQADFWSGASEPPAPAAAPRLQPALPSAPLGARPPRPRAAPSAPAPRTAAKSAVSPSGVSPSGVPAATTPSSADARPASAAPAAAPEASVEQALETVTGHVQRCFREQLPGSSELGVEAMTRLGLWVEPDGELLRAQFEPPLAPAVEACVVAQLAHLRVARSPAGFRVERDIRLRR